MTEYFGSKLELDDINSDADYYKFYSTIKTVAQRSSQLMNGNINAFCGIDEQDDYVVVLFRDEKACELFDKTIDEMKRRAALFGKPFSDFN